jgi:hypothetical protein
MGLLEAVPKSRAEALRRLKSCPTLGFSGIDRMLVN